MSESHFDDDRRASTTSRSRPTSSSTTCAKRASFVRRALPAAGRRSTSAAAPARWPRAWRAPATRWSASIPPRGCCDVLERATRRRSRRCVASGTALPFADDELRPRPTAWRSMHHIAEPDDVRRTLAEMVRVTRPGGRVLVWDHNPRNPYWRLLMARVPQDTGEERLIGVDELLRGLIDAGAEPVLVTRSGMVPDFTPRASSAPRRPPSARRSARRSCAGSAPTTWSWRRKRQLRATDRRGPYRRQSPTIAIAAAAISGPAIGTV